MWAQHTRGTSPLRVRGHPAHNHYIIKSGISDIVIGESCDIEMESGGEVGTLVSWHTVASGHQAPPLHTPPLRVSRQITILQSLYPV